MFPNLLPLQLNETHRQRFSQIHRLEQLATMDPVEFEWFVGYLYEHQGYKVFLTGVTGDEGIDLLLTRGAETVVVQCKRYAGTVGQPVVRDLFGTMMHNQAQQALLVTTGSFSKAAADWAVGKPIELIDGHALMGLIRKMGRSTDGELLALPRWLPIAAAAFLLLILCLISLFLLRTLLRSQPDPVINLPTIGASSTSMVAAASPTLAPTVTLAPAQTPTTIPTPSLTPTPGPPTPLPITAINFAVSRLLFTPTIDGDLAEWAYVEPRINTPYITERLPSWDGSLDIVAIWQLGWDTQYLYVAVWVEDDIHVQTQEVKFAYLGDSVELQFDTELEADYGPLVSPDDFQYVVSPGDFATIVPAAFRFRGDSQGNMNDAPGTQAIVAARRTAVGYTLEFAIPWSDMGVRPQSGLQIGVALSVNDNDTPGTAQQELMLSHISTRLWLDPSSWGIMTLR